MVFVIVIVAVLITAATAFGINEWLYAGQRIKEISQNKNTEVVAKVGNVEITKNQVDQMMEFYKLQDIQFKEVEAEAQSQSLPVPPKPIWDYDKVLQKLIEDELIYQEAKSEGYEVSMEYAQKYADQTRETIQKIVNGEIDTPDKEDTIKVYNNVKEYMKGMGMTEDEYWDSVMPEYQRALTIGKFKGKLRNEIPAEKRNDAEYVDSYMKSYTDKLWDKYNVEILK